MRISRKAEYALRAVLDLAIHAPPDGGVRSADIARRTRVPGKFLEVILRDLHRAGLLTSRRGRTGGYRLAQDPARLTVRAVLAATDGPLRPPPGPGRHPESPVDACLRGVWTNLAASLNAAADAVTIDDLRRRAAAPGAPDYTI